MASLSLGERARRSLWRAAPKRVLSTAIGWGARARLPQAWRASLTRAFVERHGIDVGEAEKPLDAYQGLHDFFTRRLRAGARPIDGTPGTVVSPADGTVVDAGVAAAGRMLEAKSTPFTLGELLADDGLAVRLLGGSYAIVYLSPRDYHRVHFPAGGRVVAWHAIPGLLFPVNERSVLREPGLFARNERFVTVIESEAGLAAVVMVAAVGVGHITASYDADVATHAPGFINGTVRRKRIEPPLAVSRGDELGVFNLGSTVIVVFEPGRVALDDLTVGGKVTVGRAIGRVLTAPTRPGAAT